MDPGRSGSRVEPAPFYALSAATRNSSETKMWRQKNTFMAENQDSDQSISEDEDIDCSWPSNPRDRNNKDGFEMPTIESGFSKFAESSSSKLFVSNSDEETISDDEENNVTSNFNTKFLKNRIVKYEIENKDEDASTWSSVLKETEELVCLHHNAASSSSHAVNFDTRKIWKGKRGKAKPKFSINFMSHDEEPSSLSSIAKDGKEKSSRIFQVLEGLEDIEDTVTDHSMTEILEDLQEEKDNHSKIQVFGKLADVDRRNTQPSIFELLEGVQEKNEPRKGTLKLNTNIKGRKFQITRKRNVYRLGDRILDKEDPAEPLDSDTSSEDETAKLLLQANDGDQIRLASLESKGQTMADRFQEALIAAPVSDRGSLFGTSNQTGTGYYGRLQQIMQTEKERHVEFMKQIQGTSRHDETNCIDVMILSRYLDAKLTVCQCSFGENNLSPLNFIDYGTKRTVIFSSRICGHVELEIGSFIRVHPPWKEVKVEGNDDSIVLCTYFSEIPI